MKKSIAIWMTAVFISIFSLSSPAQQTKAPKWVSDKGYWVVETNVRDPYNHVIRFYNNANVMIYKETLTGVKLNTNKKKVKVKLTHVLENSALAWEQRKMPEEEKQYVSAILK